MGIDLVNCEKYLYILPWNNPYWNLALEDALFQKIAPGQEIILAYENRPCVVWGRFQNPWREVNLAYLSRAGLLPVRRKSGGGCVYHGPGNWNLSFIRGQRTLAKEENAQKVQAALASIGVVTRLGPRGELWKQNSHNERKISGAAFKQARHTHYHHLTLLFDCDLEAMQLAITSLLKNQVQGKGILSVPSLVENLGREKIKPFFNALAQTCQGRELKVLGNDCYQGVDARPFQSPSWIWGDGPSFRLD